MLRASSDIERTSPSSSTASFITLKLPFPSKEPIVI
ncbi:hypothetical protein NT07LI_4062, partial [Listeria innocua FSL S4-378]